MTYLFDDLLPIFYTQLQQGCNGIRCYTPECRSCNSFKYRDCIENDFDVIITSLATDYENNKSILCKNLSPLVLNPKISIKLIEFFDFAQNFIHDLDVSSTLSALNNIFDLPDAFCHIFVTQDGLLSHNDLQINIEMCIEFHDALKRRIDSLNSKIIRSFSRFIQTFSNISNNETLHWIRGLFILSIFSPLIKNINHNDNYFIALFEKVTKLCHLSLDVFFNTLVRNPILIQYINEAVQVSIDAYIKSNNPDPHNSQMHSIASIVELLSEANVLCDKPIPQEYFINEEFNRCILPEFEFKLYMKNMFSYLKTPSILSFGFKGLMLKHYSRTLNKKAITIRRSNIVEDAIEHVLKLPKEELQKHMTIQFDGENAQDSGGVSREFFLLLVNEFFSEEYKLFNEIESGLFWFISQKHSQQKNGNLKERLINFKYVGILVGLALSNSIILPIRFPLFLYKKLYNMQLSFKDYEDFDPEAADGLRKLKNIKTEEEMDMACLYFTAMSSDKTHEIPIVPGGLDKQVTLENVDEYIEKKIHFHMSEEIKDEFNMFQEGLLMSEPQILKTFKFFDMDTLISGTQVLDWPALKSKASYVNGLNENSPSVVMFWKIFFEMDDKKKALMLQFITGCARAPPGGLEAVSLVISRSSDVDKLPTAHTCSSTLVLPDYRNEATMKRALDICTGNAEGFGLI